MEDAKNIFGTKKTMDYRQAVQLLETAVCEGFSAAYPLPAGIPHKNIFERPVHYFQTDRLSAVAGMAASGLRVSAAMGPEKLLLNTAQLSAFAQQHFPAVFHVSNREQPAALPLPSTDAGFVVLSASDVQQAVDFALISRKISELSLLPGIVLSPAAKRGPVAFPEKDILRRFLGAPDDQIESPTPAQEIIFGKQRRRVPNWYSFDAPILLGPWKDPSAGSLENAAQQQFFLGHLPELIRLAFDGFNRLADKHYRLVETFGMEKADYAVIVHGAIREKAKEAVEQLKKEEKARISCLVVHLVRPFPTDALGALLPGIKALTVLEAAGITTADPLSKAVGATVQQTVKRPPEMYTGLYGADISVADIVAAFRNMMKGGAKRSRFFLGVDFTHRHPSSPQHEILLQSIKRAYPEIGQNTLSDASFSKPAPEGEAVGEGDIALDPPYTIRQYRDQGPPYTRLSRFYNDTARFFETGDRREMVADPFQAVPAVPPATASFSGLAALRTRIPSFFPDLCTGCGDCFVYCPHSAIPPLVLSPETLIRGGMDIAARRGNPLTQFTPIVRNLAKVAAQVIRKRSGKIQKAGDFLPEAFGILAEKMDLKGEKRSALESELGILISVLQDFQTAATETFFLRPESIEKGSGELFTLSPDPHACTGCGLCAQLCEPKALVMETQTPDLIEALQSAFQRWEQLPDTASETIRRLHHDESYNSLAAVLLSRNFYLSITGGSRSEKDAPAKTAVHLATAVTESVVQPRYLDFAGKIAELIKALSDHIHQGLSDALPKDNFDALLDAITHPGSQRLHLDEIVGTMGAREHLKLVDTAALQRKIGLLNDLKTLHWEILEGPTGTGRARQGILGLGQPASWIGPYPFNVFSAPVLLVSADFTAEAVQGLIAAQIRHLLDNIRLLRRARLEAAGKYQPPFHDEEIAALQWDDLETGERGLLPPILVLARKRDATRRHAAQLNGLLASSLPVKIILTDDGLLAAEEDPAVTLARENTLILSALTTRQAFVFQGSPDQPGAFFAGMTEGLKTSGPALLIVSAPDQEAFDIGGRPWPVLNRLARQSRSLPALKAGSQPDQAFLSVSLELEGNESAGEDWHQIPPYEEKESAPYTLTFADWLFLQSAWKTEFRPAGPAGNDVLPVAGYLALGEADRKNRLPVVRDILGNGATETYIASEKVIRATLAARRQWRTLQEIAGLTTPFPRKMRETVEKELNEKHQAAVDEIRKNYEEKLRRQEQELMEQVKVRLREKLLALSRKGENRVNNH